MPDPFAGDRIALVDGRRICYRLEGATDLVDAATIVLIAGLGEDLTQWGPEIVAALGSAGLRVLRLDNRDSGRSEYEAAPAPSVWRQALGRPHPDGYTLTDMAADVVALLDVLEIPAAHLLGRSMGGMIAQTVAARWPARVLTLASLYSTTGEKGVGGYTLGTMRRMAAPPPTSRESAVRRHVAMTRHVAGPAYPIEVARERAAAALTWDRNDGDGGAGVARQVQAIQLSGDRTEELRGITVPTLVVHGDTDPLVAPSGGRATAAAVPGATYVEIPGMGHHLPPALVPVIAGLVLDHVAGRPVRPPDPTHVRPLIQEPTMTTSHDFSATRVMPAPVATVWDITADPRRNPEWVGNVRSVPRSSDAYAIGESFEEVSVVLGPWTTRTIWTTLAIEHHRSRHQVGQGFPGLGEIRPYVVVEPVPDGADREHCRITYGAEITFASPLTERLMLGLLGPMMRREFSTSLENLEVLVRREVALSCLRTAGRRSA